MKIRFHKTIATLLFSLATSAVSAAPFLQESFETGSLSAVSAAGFSWSGPNNTSVVQKGVDGQYSLKFNYLAGAAMSEQRFSLGAAYKDVWIRFWTRVPTNFSHGSANNKFFALWMDGYSSKGDGPTVVWESWGDGSGGSKLAVHYSEGAYVGAGSHIQTKPFVAVPGDRGKWMQVVMHVKAASVRTTPINVSSYPYLKSDGVVELWRRWQGQATFEKLHEVTSANIAPPAAGPAGWSFGYFMGWANSAYTADTEWLVDLVEMSAQSLLDTGATAVTVTPPASPVLSVKGT